MIVVTLAWGPSTGKVVATRDALHVPQQRVQVLMVPMQASWLKTSEAVAFLRAVGPRLALGMHDAQVNDRGLSSTNSWLRAAGGTDHRWLRPGTGLPDLA